MKVTLNFKSGYCTVEKEEGDPRFTRGGYSDAESTFLYHVKQELIKQGYDVIKKRMWKDGHMVADTQQYIRTRSWSNKPGEFAIWNGMYATYDAGEKFNIDGFYTLQLDTLDGSVLCFVVL